MLEVPASAKDELKGSCLPGLIPQERFTRALSGAATAPRPVGGRLSPLRAVALKSSQFENRKLLAGVGDCLPGSGGSGDVARALMAAPRILFVDEPSVGLAPILVSRVPGKIRELKERRQLTVLMAEQNFNQATKIADRGYIIFEGRSTQELRENELVKKYYMRV
jgi:ABC-type transport system involved in cytochrome bd biosynthesis fused ATPase/permease subunit